MSERQLNKAEERGENSKKNLHSEEDIHVLRYSLRIKLLHEINKSTSKKNNLKCVSSVKYKLSYK